MPVAAPPRIALWLLALCAFSLLGGCGRDAAREPGVVAVVAGSPIRLADVEARHDLGEIGLPEAGNPPVARLRAAYGRVLADMVVARLVRQELARRHQAVTGEELAAAEKQVRGDYPGDSFERMLLEERIDLARWREMLADRLALEKFKRAVLLPDVRVEVTEAADYYKRHIEAFTIPARLRLTRVLGRGDADLKVALTAYRRSGRRMESLPGLSGITVQEGVLPENGLPAAVRQALRNLGDGEATGILTEGGERFFCILHQRLPATVIDPAKAYARVEAILAGRKTDDAFAAWLGETLRTAKISINKELLAAMSPGRGPAAVVAAREETGPSDRPGEILPAQARPGTVPPEIAANAGDEAPPHDTPPREPAVAEVPAEAAPAAAPAVAAQGDVPTAAPVKQSVPAASDAPSTPEAAPAGGGTVEFSAVKASWIRYAVDDGEEKRVYLKPGKPYAVPYTKKLFVRLGSPSELRYRHNGREETVAVGNKENRTLEFP